MDPELHSILTAQTQAITQLHSAVAQVIALLVRLLNVAEEPAGDSELLSVLANIERSLVAQTDALKAQTALLERLVGGSGTPPEVRKKRS